jgi:hypothetical protein
MFTFALTSVLLACTRLCAADSKTVDKTLRLAANGSVTIESHNGSITVHTWDRPQIEIHARIEMSSWSGFSSADRRRYDDTRVDIDTFGDSVRIKSNYPLWDWSLGSNPDIHYTITAPRTARWTIRDHNSRIEVHDLNAPLSIFTHNSRVIVDGLAGALELDAHNGDARVEFASFTASSSVDMHNGDVELVLPANSKFDLRSSAHNADLQSDFPVMTHTIGWRGANADGMVNGGGPGLRLSTHNGNFRIRAK